MAGTRRLDWLVSYARERGALVRLLGDPAQMSPVEAGGALRLLHTDAGGYQLTDLHRFTNPDEAAATLKLRAGEPAGLDFYTHNQRVADGTPQAIRDHAYDAWTAAHEAHRSSLLIAGSARDVAALNARTRTDRVTVGLVHADGVLLVDGNTAGTGDRIITRTNNRTLTTSGGDFVKNGDLWTITKHHRNGDLTARRLTGTQTVRLPADYVRSHVELGYAVTTARAQGITVDTAHVLVDETTTRESLYVAATRGRDGAHLYVTTEQPFGLDAERPPRPDTEAHDLLTRVLNREAGEQSATEVSRSDNTQTRPATQSWVTPSALDSMLRRRRLDTQQATPVRPHPSTVRRYSRP